MRGYGVLRWIVGILCAALACLLAVLLIRYHQSEQAHEEHIAQLRKEAETYEARLKAIRKELDDMENRIGSDAKTGMIMVAWQVESVEDVQHVSEQAEQESIEPVIVVDVHADALQQILSAVNDAGCELVLTAYPFDADTPKDAANLRKTLKQDYPELRDMGLFLMREAYENEENLALLSDGFDGCVSYYTHPAFSEAHPDFQLMNYSFLRSATFAVQNRLKALSSGSEALMFVFDLSAAELTPEVEGRFLSTICSYAEAHALPISTAEETIAAIRENQVNTNSSQEAYEKLLSERQEEIDELNAKLDEIYSRWNEEQKP